MSTRPERGRRHLPKRVRLDTTGVAVPRRRSVTVAVDQVRAAGTVPVLGRHLNRRQDAERRLSLLGFEVAKTVHGTIKGHRMLVIDLVRLINAFDSPTLRELGMSEWARVGDYDRVHRLHAKIADALEEGWLDTDPATGREQWIDLAWYRTAVIRAPIPPGLIAGCGLAVDATAMSTWGRLHSGGVPVAADGIVREDPGP